MIVKNSPPGGVMFLKNHTWVALAPSMPEAIAQAGYTITLPGGLFVKTPSDVDVRTVIALISALTTGS